MKITRSPDEGRIFIPPEAVEAGARAILHAIIYDIEPDVRANGLTDEECATIARAAFVAMVEAWPGMIIGKSLFDGEPTVFLPIPQEKQDD